MSLNAQTGNALHFDAVDDEITVSNPTAFDIGTSSDLLVTASIKTTVSASRDPIFSRMDAGGTIRGYQIWLDANGKLQLEWNSSTGGVNIESTSSINDRNCHDIKVEMIRSTGIATLTVDGNVETTLTHARYGNTSDATATGGSSTPTFIGSERTNSASFLWNGEIEDLKVTIGGVLQGSWDFNEGIAGGTNAGVTTLTDNSGQGNDGTL